MPKPQKTPPGANPPLPRHHPRHIFRHILHRPRLALAVLFFLFLALVLPGSLHAMVRILISFDSATLLFLLAAARMMGQATPDTMRHRAMLEDEGKWVVLGLSCMVAFAVLAAVLMEKAGAHQGGMGNEAARHLAAGRLALAIITIILAWLFINTIFAIHYAHDYYSPKSASTRGLLFPGTAQPDYWDFIYFAFVLGMTFQVSDVQITCRPLRRLAVLHGTLAFFFNVFILALSVNIIAGAF